MTRFTVSAKARLQGRARQCNAICVSLQPSSCCRHESICPTPYICSITSVSVVSLIARVPWMPVKCTSINQPLYLTMYTSIYPSLYLLVQRINHMKRGKCLQNISSKIISTAQAPPVNNGNRRKKEI